ncbi:MAG: 2-amino-4-hydroxy-6-hydroxymethyldihydropteridine diphosphokinase [Steroidobacteraceae bacterium]
MAQVYVAAGSNIDPQVHLVRAQTELTRLFGALTVSPWYRNAAVGFEGEDFINFVFGFRTGLNVHEVQAQLREVEAHCGRPPDAPKWAARAIDLDILLYGDLVLNEPALKLPRPDLLVRPYMLGPLADLAPDLRHPTAGSSIAQLWAAFDPAAHAMIVVRPAAMLSPCG